MWTRSRTAAPAAPRLSPAWFLLVLGLLAPVVASAAPQEPPPEEAAVEAPADQVEDQSRKLEDQLEYMEEHLEEVGEEIEGRLEERRDRIRQIREDVRRKVHESTRRDRSDSKVSFGGSIHLEEDEVARDLVAIGGSIHILGDIYGDAVAVGGSVHVHGRVTGDVVAVGGKIVLGPEAKVLGEATSVGGRVERAEGSEVLGGVNEVALGPELSLGFSDWTDWIDRQDRDDHDHWRPSFGFGDWMGLGWSLTALVMLLLLTALVQLIGAGAVEAVRQKAVEAPWVSGLIGLAIQLLFLPSLILVILLLVISIIGIPLLLLIPFGILAFVLACLVGYTGSAMAVGRWAERRFGWTLGSPFVALIVGVLLIQALSFLGDAFDIGGGFLRVFGIMFGLAGFLVRYAAWTVGLGAVCLAGFGGSRRRRVPPPVPEAEASAAVIATPEPPPAPTPPESTESAGSAGSAEGDPPPETQA